MATQQEFLQAIKNANDAGDTRAVEVLTGLYNKSQGIQSLQSQEPDAEVGNFLESLIGGTKRYFSGASTGVEAPFTSGEDAAVRGIKRQEGYTERPGASWEAVKKTFEKEGVIGATGEIVSQVPTALAEQTPVLASMWAGYKIGFALPLPPQGKIVAGVFGSLLMPFLSMAGNNMERKAQEDIKAGRPVDIDEASAYGTALVQASLERAGVGLSGVSKLMGIGNISKLLKIGGTKNAEKLAREGLAKTVAMGTGRLAAAEGTTEVTQQALERYYAGLSLTDEEAQKEYIEAAFAAALLGPTVGIGARVKAKAGAQQEFAEAEAKKQLREETQGRQMELDLDEDLDEDQEGPTISSARDQFFHLLRRAEAFLEDKKAAWSANSDYFLAEVAKIKEELGQEAADMFYAEGLRITGEKALLEGPEEQDTRQPTLFEGEELPIPEVTEEERRQELERETLEEINRKLGLGTQKPILDEDEKEKEYDGSESYKDLKKKKIIKIRRVQQTDTIDKDVLDILGIKPRTIADRELTEDLDLNNPEVIDQVDNILKEASKLEGPDTDAINDYRNKLAEKKKALLAAQNQQQTTGVITNEQEILDFIDTQENLSISKLRKQFKLTKEQATEYLEDGVNAGVLTKTQRGKAVIYKKDTEQKAASERLDIIKKAAEKKDIKETTANENVEIDDVIDATTKKGVIKSQKAKASNPELKGRKITVAQVDPNTKQVIPMEGTYVFRNGEPFLKIKDKNFRRTGQGKNQKIVEESTPGTVMLTRIDEGALINPTEQQLAAVTKEGAKQEKKIVKTAQEQTAKNKAKLEMELKEIELIEAGRMDIGFDPDSVLLEKAESFTVEKRLNRLLRNYRKGMYNDFIDKKENKKLKFYLKNKLNSRRPGTEKDKKVIQGLKGKKTLGQALTTLNTKFNKSLTDAQQQFLPILLGTPKIPSTTFKFDPGMENKDRDGAYGSYSVKDDIIKISDKADIETVMHEGTHAATATQLHKHVVTIEDPKKGKIIKTKSSIGRRLVQLYNDAKRADTDNTYKEELDNIDEFVTNGLNSGAFQVFLAGIRATPTDFKAPPAPPSGESEIEAEGSYIADLDRKGATDQEIDRRVTEFRGINAASDTSVWSQFVKVVKAIVGANAVPDNVLNDVLAIAPSLFFGPNAAEQALRDVTFYKKTGRGQSQSSLEGTLESLETPREKAKKKEKADGPTSNQPKKSWGEKLTERGDKIVTALFSFDAGLNNKVKREMLKDKKSWALISKTLNRMTVSQALHAENIAQQFLVFGEITYNPDTGQVEVVDNPDAPSFNKIVKRVDELAASYGINPKTFRQMVHKNFVARRAQSLKEYNAELVAQTQLLEAQGKTKQAEKLWDDNKIIIDLSQDQINQALEFENDFPEINELHDSWIQSKNNLIKFLVESELMTPEQADEFMAVVDVEGAPQETVEGEGDAKTFGDTYVPFFREDTRKKPSEYQQTRLGDRGKYYSLKGSYEPVADIFDNMQLWMRDSVKRGIMNRKAIDKINAIRELPQEVQDSIVEEKTTSGEPNTIAMSRVISKKNSVTGEVTHKREVINYKFSDPMYAQAFSGMDRVALSGLGFFSNVSNFLRTNVVLYPLFSLAQLPQDSVSAMFSSGVRNPFMIPLRVLAEFPLTLLDKSKTHDIGKRFGFAGGFQHLQNETAADRDINVPGFYNAIRRAAGKVPGLTPEGAIEVGDKKLSATGFLNRLAMASDNAVRQAVYDQTMSETNNQALAVERAFEVINFKRAGANNIVTGLRSVVPFFGAFLQAASVQGRAITGAGITPQSRAKGVQQFLMTGAQLTALTLLYAAMASDDDEYEKLDPTIRDRRFLLGNGTHITLRPDLFTYMFKIIPEHILQNMVMESEDNRKTYDSLKRALKEVGLFNILPQAIRPAMSLMYNYDPRTGRAITPPSAEKRVTERQVTAGTSELAKLLSGIINKPGSTDTWTSPIKLDYFLRQYFGYTGGLITMITSSMIDEYDVFDYDKPTKSDRDMLASIPGMSAFISREYGNRHTSDYYQLRGEVSKIVGAYKDLEKLGFDPKKTQKYVKDHFGEITIKPLITSLQKQLSAIRDERNKVLLMPRTRITPDGRKDALDRLYQFERAILSQMKEVRKNIYGTGFKDPR